MRCNVLTAGLILLGFCFVSLAGADMYKYTDDTGSVCMTNTLESVPKKYRSSMTVIKENAPARNKLLPEVEKRSSDPAPYVAPVAQEMVKESQPVAVNNREKYIRTALIVAGIIAGYFILTRLSGSLGFPRVGTLLFLLITLTGGVYLYGMYINEMRATFSNMSKDAKNIKKNVETREVKTDQLLKQQPESE